MNLIPIKADELMIYRNEEQDITIKYSCLNGDNQISKDELIYNYRLSNPNDENPILLRKLTNDLFDLFVKGWESKTLKLEPFPSDGKPSRCFPDMDAKDFIVYSVILPSQNLSVSEKKN
jgi:hypothetical protein